MIFFFLADFPIQPAWAASAHSPRHTGLEPPGGPRPLEAIPGGGAGTGLNDGMRRRDAYGNEIGPYEEPEKKPRRRLRQGAYGGQREAPQSNRLPDPQGSGKPLWKFQ